MHHCTVYIHTNEVSRKYALNSKLCDHDSNASPLNQINPILHGLFLHLVLHEDGEPIS